MCGVCVCVLRAYQKKMAGTLFYSDGALRYRGDLVDDMCEGYGTEFHPNGGIKYRGEWTQNKAHGKGESYCVDGKLTYRGQFQHGRCDGHGEAFSADETLQYDGGFAQGKRHGTGISYSETTRLYGTWNNGRLVCGKQVRKSTGNTIYEGGFLNGKRSGQGNTYYPDGVLLYSGQFENNLKHGAGVAYKNGMRLYDGQWKKGLFEGQGRSYKNGMLVWDGTWRAGVLSGAGKAYDVEGRLHYEGQFENNRRHGYGTMYENHHVLYEGNFADHHFEGLGTLYRDGKRFYVGEFRRDARTGVGTEYRADGTVLEGIFERGVFDEERSAKRRKVLDTRDQVVQMHQTVEGMCEVPQCTMCFEHLHHGDASFAYVPCGHRAICATCEKGLEGIWRHTCPVCKEGHASLLRIF